MVAPILSGNPPFVNAMMSEMARSAMEAMNCIIPPAPEARRI